MRGLLWRIYRPFAGLVAWTAKLGWRLGGRPWSSWERHGLVPVPLHYYHPYPDSAELERSGYFERASAMRGIDLDPSSWLALLDELGRGFGEECRWPERSQWASSAGRSRSMRLWKRAFFPA